MRTIAIMLGCTALLSVGANAANDHSYRADIRYSKAGADSESFNRDRDQCLHDTDTWRRLVSEDIRPGSSSRMFHVSTGEHHGVAFHQCMTAKGYRADPNGLFRVSFSTAL